MLDRFKWTLGISAAIVAGAMMFPAARGQSLPQEQQLTLLLGQTYLELVQARATLQQQTALLQSKIDWWSQCAASMECSLWVSQGSKSQSLQNGPTLSGPHAFGSSEGVK